MDGMAVLLLMNGSTARYTRINPLEIKDYSRANEWQYCQIHPWIWCLVAL
ncbi:MAG: hypothetical protein NZ888_08040 [Candidatus Nitrosocaldus sp.]|nr:hypothetical protein [Candidatus Nitrosocaldus sp.]MDW8000015.1 hypothetical protein [Candidatus Nitrosocaldus sp.]